MTKLTNKLGSLKYIFYKLTLSANFFVYLRIVPLCTSCFRYIESWEM